MSRKKILVGVVILIGLGALVWANVAFKKEKGPTVTAEAIRQRDIEAIVSASGKIRARRTVNITSEVSGKVVQLAVNEGDRVKAGQFLLQIDPRNLRSRMEISEATLAQMRIALQQARIQAETAKADLKLAQDEQARQQALWKDKLTTQQAIDQARTTVAQREGALQNAQQAMSNADQRIRSQSADLQSARHDLSRVNILAPIDGLVTRRNVEEGETAVVGFTNNPSVVLLTVADMSVIEAEIEVDETDIPSVQLGQATKVTIDALPDKTFTAKVTEIGNSPIQSAGSLASASGTQATNFKVVVTLDQGIPEVRPGFTCTADITTATRKNVAAVPIQAMTLRELVYDEKGQVVKPPKDEKARRSSRPAATTVEAAELKPGQTRKETEGVFVLGSDELVRFVPVKTGIAGDRYFEVLQGLKAGDRVVTGPFESVRNLADDTKVKVEDKAGTAPKA